MLKPCLAAGACPVTAKPKRLRVAALPQVVIAGALALSPRETGVLAWLAGRKTNGDIAQILGLLPVTIKHCVERIYAKLNVRTRAAATAQALAAAGVRD